MATWDGENQLLSKGWHIYIYILNRINEIEIEYYFVFLSILYLGFNFQHCSTY